MISNALVFTLDIYEAILLKTSQSTNCLSHFKTIKKTFNHFEIE